MRIEHPQSMLSTKWTSRFLYSFLYANRKICFPITKAKSWEATRFSPASSWWRWVYQLNLCSLLGGVLFRWRVGDTQHSLPHWLQVPPTRHTEMERQNPAVVQVIFNWTLSSVQVVVSTGAALALCTNDLLALEALLSPHWHTVFFMPSPARLCISLFITQHSSASP